MAELVITIVGAITITVGLSVLILWMKDRGGCAGVAIERVLGCAAFSIGAAIVGGMFYVLLFRREELHITFLGVFQLIVPVAFLYVGWKWLTSEGPGIEDTPVDFKCRELEESIDRAKATLPWFIEQVDKNIDGAFIKYALRTPNDNIEHIWAYVHAYREGSFHVSLANDPYDIDQESSGRISVPSTEVEDWQIMYPDGRIKGAYSLIALFKNYEARGRPLSKKMQKQKAQLMDA